jgi:hypothetical protein
MADEQKATVEDIGDKGEASRQRSTIGFPYNDLKSAIELAEAIHTHVGTGQCDDTQLAAWTNQSSKSSGFRTQVYAARMFGLLAGEGTGSHSLTDLGRAIVDPDQTREAKARAFMAVPLYRAVFEHYKGHVLPPAAALERDMVGMGVSEKQKDRARQVFERSAEQAGYFEHGKNKLVAPGVQQGTRQEPKRDDDKRGGGGGGGDDGDVDPIIKGLLARLPPTGASWPSNERKLWLDLLENSFKLIYRDEVPGHGRVLRPEDIDPDLAPGNR